ncbi:MAG TPA: asparagine synthase-related protein [Solirubrobacterales bacterium]|nr:asparagine synthase-related protein [Solirubrobacterales bacterium]
MQLAAAAIEALPQLDPLEVSAGMVFGPRRQPDPDVDRLWPIAGPRATLEEILLGALAKPPCVVAFSGGRDSSAILAEATRIARANGLEDPIPHTLRFGGAPRTDEVEWQEAVVGHLGLASWSRRDVGEELDSLGPLAQGVLLRHGVHWPPNVHTLQLMLEPAIGGSLVTGNGGDELFTPWVGHRMSLLRRGRARPRRYELRPLLRALLPRRLLAELWFRRDRYRLPWLVPDAARRIVRNVADELMGFDDSWPEALERYLGSRYLEVSQGLIAALGRDAGVEVVEPFFDPRYVRAVYSEAPAQGYASRSIVMERNFGDLLPEKVTRRSTKAVFTEVFTGPEVRRFAREWDGSGVDTSLIEPEKLRDMWLSPVPDLRSLVPLQAAWLASR